MFCISSAVFYNRHALIDVPTKPKAERKTNLFECVVGQLIVLLVLFCALSSLATTNVLDDGCLVRWVLLLIVIVDEQCFEVCLIGRIHARVRSQISQTMDIVLLFQQDRQWNGVLCGDDRMTETSVLSSEDLTFGSANGRFLVSHDLFELLSIFFLFLPELVERASQDRATFVERIDDTLALLVFDGVDRSQDEFLQFRKVIGVLMEEREMSLGCVWRGERSRE